MILAWQPPPDDADAQQVFAQLPPALKALLIRYSERALLAEAELRRLREEQERRREKNRVRARRWRRKRKRS